MKKLLLMAAAALMSSAAMAQLEDGKYFVKNNESGQFLSNGANWGTRSVLFGRGIEYGVTVGADGKYTLKSGIKGTSQALRPSDGFNDQSGAWELQPAEGGYYMYNGSKYFCNDASGVPQYKDTPDASCVWSFVTADERKALLSGASKTTPVDATVFIKAADFHNGDVENSAWSKTKIGGDFGSGCSIINSANCEQWNAGVFDVSQKITGLPNGVYTVSCQGYTRLNGATVASADSYENGDVLPAYLYAGDKQVALKSIFADADTESKNGWSTIVSTAGNQYVIANGQNTAAVKFTEGAYVNVVEEVIVTDGTLTLGVKSEGGIEWVVFDSFRLTYYGVDLSILQTAFATSLENAKNLTGAMNADVKAALVEAYNKYKDANPTTEEELNAATGELNAAIAAAEASIAVYEKIAAIDLESLTESGKAVCKINGKYAAGEYETLAEAQADFRVAVLAQTEDGADFTGAIINPNFDGNINGWAHNFTTGNNGFQNAYYNNAESGVSISQFMECWVPKPTSKENGKLSQVLKNLPAGNYTLSADLIAVQQSGAVAREDQKGVYVFATCAAGTFKSVDCSTGDGKPEHFSFTFNTTEGDCEIGLMTENTNCNWVAFDNCRLVRNGETTVNVYQEVLKETVAKAEANLDEVECAADLKVAYAAAYAAANKIAETDDLENEAYLEAGSALADAKAAVEASAVLYANSKTLRDAVAAGTNVAVYADAIADWTLDHEDGNFHFNTWSTEGLSDGTNMGQNFNEYWHNSSASLADGVISYKTLGGLKAGNYAVSVFVRAINEAGGEVSGVKFNDIDITTANATYVKFNALEGVYGAITSVINVAEGGNLDFGFTVKDAACNWIAWKGLTIKYLGEETADAEASLEITKAGYATFVAPYTTALPAGVKAYTVDNVDDNGTTLVMTEIVGAVPAYTPVVLEGEAVSVTTTGVDYTTVQCETPLVKGMLTGVLSEDVAPEGTFVLQQHGSTVAFFRTESDMELPANRAYLTADAAEVKAFTLGNATAIKALESMTAGKAQIFDLNGRQINSLQKGINIVNGVKVLVK